MSDTLPNVTVSERVWTNIYAATGITVGTQILVQNIGSCDVYLTSQAAAPTDDTAHQIVKRGQFALNDPDDAGAWAYCQGCDGLLNVRLP